MKKLLALPLSLACMHAAAQSPVTLMPEGSRDVAVGMTFASVPAFEGSAQRRNILVPHFSVQWSNGVFLEGLSLGLQLPSEPHIAYGLLLSADLGSGSAELGAKRPRRHLVPGAFLRYALLHNLRLESNILYGVTPDGGGVLFKAAAVYRVNLAPHHNASIAAGLEAGSRHYVQSEFGVTPERAAATGMRAHEAGAGVTSLFLRAGWNWQASRKYTVNSSVTFTRLRGSAAAGPIVETPNGVILVTSLIYRF